MSFFGIIWRVSLLGIRLANLQGEAQQHRLSSISSRLILQVLDVQLLARRTNELIGGGGGLTFTAIKKSNNHS